jgi:competence protein ComEA
VAFLGARWVRAGGAGGPAGAAVAATARPTAAADAARVTVRPASAAAAIVHVAGAVRRPGVYRLRAGARVQDAVRRAGGGSANADLNGLNLAAKVEDGRQIIVPTRAGASSAAAGVAATGAAPSGAGAAGANAPPVNLNTATLEQLGTLDGVGPATARKIMEYREAHGGFGSVDDLDGVPGIGPKRLAALREHVTT